MTSTKGVGVVPRFIVQSPSILLSTSYKVMYSSLRDCGKLEPVEETEFLAKTIRAKADGSLRHIMPVRNPYDRLLSFFSDKLRQNIPTTVEEWQYCQLIFLPLKGASGDTPFHAARQALTEISFPEFVEYLPNVMWNGHLKKQSDLLSCDGECLRKFTQIFPIEHASDELWRQLKVRFPHKKNQSNNHPDLASLSRAHVELINELYALDFTEFGYEMRQ